jgi:hypothetical protein
MVTVTAEDLLRVEEVEQELAAAGREPERAAVHKALTLLRRAAIERLERSTGADTLPSGVLPNAGASIRSLSEGEAHRLSALQAESRTRRLTAVERREFQTLLERAESGAMGNVLALVRDHAPDSDIYLRALQAYRRSFARHARAAAATPEDGVSSIPPAAR